MKLLTVAAAVLTLQSSSALAACGYPGGGSYRPVDSILERSGAISSNREGAIHLYRCVSTIRCLPGWTVDLFKIKDGNHRLKVIKFYGPERKDTHELLGQGVWMESPGFAMDVPNGYFQFQLGEGSDFHQGKLDLDGGSVPLACQAIQDSES